MLDEDAVVVAKAYFPASINHLLTATMLRKEGQSRGLKKLKKGATKREALVHFGKELVEKELVKLKKTYGLKREDVLIL